MPLKFWIFLSFVISIYCPSTAACDSDADCGQGGTCIKREKRARGVCYGGNFDSASEQDAVPATPPPTPGYFDPSQFSTERPENACFVTEECPAGMECVIAGVWGTCTVL